MLRVLSSMIPNLFICFCSKFFVSPFDIQIPKIPMIFHMARFHRNTNMASLRICGAISQYSSNLNHGKVEGPRTHLQLVGFFPLVGWVDVGRICKHQWDPMVFVQQIQFRFIGEDLHP